MSKENIYREQALVIKRAEETRCPVVWMGMTFYPPGADGIPIVGPGVWDRGYEEWGECFEERRR